MTLRPSRAVARNSRIMGGRMLGTYWEPPTRIPAAAARIAVGHASMAATMTNRSASMRDPWFVGVNVVAAVLVVAVAVLAAVGITDGPVVAGAALVSALLVVALNVSDFVTHEERPQRWVAISWAIAAVGVVVVLVGLWIGPDRNANGVLGITGGCEPFMVYGQNRWNPIGAKVLAEPYRDAKQLDGVGPNKIVYVDGWVRTEVAQPTNAGSPPWDSDVWFHLANGEGWVSLAGVRRLPTDFDATGREDYGGEPAPTIEECEAALR